MFLYSLFRQTNYLNMLIKNLVKTRKVKFRNQKEYKFTQLNMFHIQHELLSHEYNELGKCL